MSSRRNSIYQDCHLGQDAGKTTHPERQKIRHTRLLILFLQSPEENHTGIHAEYRDQSADIADAGNL